MKIYNLKGGPVFGGLTNLMHCVVPVKNLTYGPIIGGRSESAFPLSTGLPKGGSAKRVGIYASRQRRFRLLVLISGSWSPSAAG